jgi:hypothetical protein
MSMKYLTWVSVCSDSEKWDRNEIGQEKCRRFRVTYKYFASVCCLVIWCAWVKCGLVSKAETSNNIHFKTRRYDALSTTLYTPSDEIIITNDWMGGGGRRKGTVVAYFKILSEHFPQLTQENNENFSHDSGPSFRPVTFVLRSNANRYTKRFGR